MKKVITFITLLFLSSGCSTVFINISLNDPPADSDPQVGFYLALFSSFIEWGVIALLLWDSIGENTSETYQVDHFSNNGRQTGYSEVPTGRVFEGNPQKAKRYIRNWTIIYIVILVVISFLFKESGILLIPAIYAVFLFLFSGKSLVKTKRKRKQLPGSEEDKLFMDSPAIQYLNEMYLNEVITRAEYKSLKNRVIKLEKLHALKINDDGKVNPLTIRESPVNRKIQRLKQGKVQRYTRAYDKEKLDRLEMMYMEGNITEQQLYIEQLLVYKGIIESILRYPPPARRPGKKKAA